jgi:hypothetical protein
MDVGTVMNEDICVDKNGVILEKGDIVKFRQSDFGKIEIMEDSWGINNWVITVKWLFVGENNRICWDANRVEKLSDEEAMIIYLEQ